MNIGTVFRRKLCMQVRYSPKSLSILLIIILWFFVQTVSILPDQNMSIPSEQNVLTLLSAICVMGENWDILGYTMHEVSESFKIFANIAHFASLIFWAQTVSIPSSLCFRILFYLRFRLTLRHFTKSHLYSFTKVILHYFPISIICINWIWLFRSL